MDPTIIVALIAVGGVVLSALAGWGSTRLTTRSTGKVEQLRVDAAAYNSARRIWDDLINDLRAEITKNRADVKGLRQRVEELERGRVTDQAMIRRLTAYAQTLYRLLHDAGIDPPPPPHPLLDDPLKESV